MAEQILDAHQHFWKFNPVRDAWITEEMSVIRRDFLPEHMHSLLDNADIGGTISVQADQSEEETKFLLALAHEYGFIRGVVGWLDLKASNFKEKLAIYSQDPYFKGLRHIVQAESPGFMRDERFRKGLSILGHHDLTYDILIYPHQLDEAIELVRQFPNQKFVLDHLAKPYIREKKINAWSEKMNKLADSSRNLYVKVSGLITEADWKNWRYEDLVPYMDVALDAFGIDRVMIGSDWPVCNVAGSYEAVMHVVRRYFSKFPLEIRKQIYFENAYHFYNLKD
jgi:L-fuconolactonase